MRALAFFLVASTALAGVYDSTPSLPGTKVDAHTATTPANQTITASEFNNLVTNTSNLNADAQSGKLLDVRAYGAKGDGATDDTAALQSAINASGSSGKPAFFPALNFKITSGLSVPGNARLIGSGAGSIISGSIGANPVFTCGSNNNLIERLNIQVTARTGIFAQGSGYVFRDNFISGMTVPGSDPGQLGGIIFTLGTDSVVSGNVLSGNGLVGGSVGGVSWGQGEDLGTYNGTDGNHRLHFINNRASSTAVAANIILFNTDQSEISGNTVTGAIVNSDGSSGGYGIAVYNTSGTHTGGKQVIRGNIVHDTYGSGIYVQANPDSLVSGNHVDNAALHQTTTSLVVAGIAVGNGARDTVTGNVVTNCTRDGIGVQGPANVVGQNTIYNPGQHGITLYGGSPVAISGLSDQTVIDGDTIYSPTWAGVATSDFNNGIYNPTKYVTISNVTVYNAGNGMTGRPGFGLANLSHSTLSNLQSYSSAGPGIELTGGGYNKLDGCRVVDGSTQGISFQGIQIVDSSYNRISGCVSRNGSTTAQTYGIQEVHSSGTSPDYNEYINNDFAFNATAGWSLLGSHDVHHGNKQGPSFAGGSTTLVAGTKTVSNASVASGDEASLSLLTPAGTQGALSVSLSAGVSFTINSSNAADTSTVNYQLRHAAPLSGTASLSTGGTVTVSTAEVLSGDTIRLTVQAPSGTQGILSLGTITGGTSFVINSSNASDRSSVFWEIVH